MIDKLKSRKLWVAVGASALATLFTQLGFDKELIEKLLLLAGGYIGAEALVDVARARTTPPEE